MIVSLYQGGLGNLLFQVAIGKITALLKNTEYKINSSLDLGRGQGYSITKYLNNIFKKINTTDIVPKIIIEESNYNDAFTINEIFGLKGFFQKSNYYTNYKKELNELFCFNEVRLNNYKKEICTLQIRTGDFLHPHHKNFNVINQKYVEKSIEFVLSKNSKIEFYLITDNYELAKNYIPTKLDIKFLNLDEINDLKLMSQSDYSIISNSSFGWWGSFLGKEKITLAPNIWSNNHDISEIYREDMIKISF
jgi:hypothetical protein